MHFPLSERHHFLPLIAGLAILPDCRRRRRLDSRDGPGRDHWLTLLLTLFLYFGYNVAAGGYQFVEGTVPWLPSLGISYFMGVDGISLPLVLLVSSGRVSVA